MDPLKLTAQETIARAFYNDIKERAQVEYPEWNDAEEIYHTMCMRRAEIALTALKPMLEAIADDIDSGADVYSRFRMIGLLINEY